MLPPGVSLDDASKDFPNQGLFIAALNASKNRPNVDFLALKEAMTVDGLSLGQAVKKVQSTAPVAPTTGGSTTGGSTTGTGTSTGSDSSGTGTTGGTTTDTSTSGTTTQK
jgi:hypothetical protein